MELTTKDITRFQKLYRLQFNITLQDDEAKNKLTKLVSQVAFLYQPITMTEIASLRDEDEYGDENECRPPEANQ